MFHFESYEKTLDCMRSKQATVDGKDMGQYFHARWRQWSFLIIKSAKYLSIGWKSRIESGCAEEVQVNVTFSKSLHHCYNGKSGWVDAMPDRKWSFQVWIDLLEELRECLPFGVNWYSISLAVMNSLRRLEHPLLRRWSCVCRPCRCMNENKRF